MYVLMQGEVMSARTLVLLMVLARASGSAARADDWPQWRGVHRDGISNETGLLKSWPKDGPKQLWKNTTAGGGYSTPSVVGDRVYLMGDQDGQEYLIALLAEDGKEQWRTKIGPVGKNTGPQYPGARSTPTVDGDRVFTLGSDGDLACVAIGTGAVQWKKNLRTDFGGKVGAWAYAESPLVDGDVLVCTPGGKDATLAALHKKTGETIWKAAVPEGDAAGYASAIAVEAGGRRQYVQFVANGLVGVDAKSGKFLWRYNKTKDQAATIPTPIFHDGCVFTSTSRNGSGLVRIKPDGVEEVYYNKTSLNSIGTPVLIGDYLYATDARGDLVCMEFKTGEVKWRNPSVGTASLCSAEGLLYVRSQGGSGFGPEKSVFVALVEATPDGYKEHGRFEQPDHGKRPAWPHPVIANGRLYLRDQGVLLCYDVKGAASGR
jgi:outer membrane protein assembly factor BamB